MFDINYLFFVPTFVYCTAVGESVGASHVQLFIYFLFTLLAGSCYNDASPLYYQICTKLLFAVTYLMACLANLVAILQMEEAKEVAMNSSVYSSQGTMLHGASRFSLDKTSPLALSAGGFQSPTVAYSPALASASASLKQPQINEIHQAVTPEKAVLGPSLASPHPEAAHLRFDARFGGPTYLTQARGNLPISPLPLSFHMLPNYAILRIFVLLA